MYTHMVRTYAERYRQGIREMRQRPEAGIGVLEYSIIAVIIIGLAVALGVLLTNAFNSRSSGIN